MYISRSEVFCCKVSETGFWSACEFKLIEGLQLYLPDCVVKQKCMLMRFEDLQPSQLRKHCALLKFRPKEPTWRCLHPESLL